MEWIDKTRTMLSNGPMTGEKAFEAYEMLEKAAAEARVSAALGVGEDVIFCRRAMAAGHQPFLDMGLLVGHAGHCVYGPHNTTG